MPERRLVELSDAVKLMLDPWLDPGVGTAFARHLEAFGRQYTLKLGARDKAEVIQQNYQNAAA